MPVTVASDRPNSVRTVAPTVERSSNVCAASEPVSCSNATFPSTSRAFTSPVTSPLVICVLAHVTNASAVARFWPAISNVCVFPPISIVNFVASAEVVEVWSSPTKVPVVARRAFTVVFGSINEFSKTRSSRPLRWVSKSPVALVMGPTSRIAEDAGMPKSVGTLMVKVFCVLS